jgi:hypothetical protein
MSGEQVLLALADVATEKDNKATPRMHRVLNI